MMKSGQKPENVSRWCMKVPQEDMKGIPPRFIMGTAVEKNLYNYWSGKNFCSSETFEHSCPLLRGQQKLLWCLS